jgi:riboflavin kinase
VHISSIKLSKNLGISQQSASRYLIELVDRGYLNRRLAQGGQVVTILEKGILTLRREFSEYSLMFGTQREIEMKGTLETGLGEGGYYISKKGYMSQFKQKLGWEPYEGTFNLRLDEDEVPKIEAMRAAEGMLISGFEQEGRTFGKAWVFNCALKNGTSNVDDCAIISPKRTHYKRVVEIISPVFLRDKLDAKDGETFIISVNLGDI